MTINVVNADIYFGPENHIKAAIWTGFSPKEKAAGIAQATRLILSIMDEDSAGLSAYGDEDGDFPRPDLAVYEQACYMLQASPVQADGQQAGPKWALQDNVDQRKDGTPPDPNALCGEALRWLARGGEIVLSRG